MNLHTVVLASLEIAHTTAVPQYVIPLSTKLDLALVDYNLQAALSDWN